MNQVFINKLLQIQFQSTISVGQPGFAGRITAIITKTGGSHDAELIPWWYCYFPSKWIESYLSLRICAETDKRSEDCCTIQKLRKTNKTNVEFVKE